MLEKPNVALWIVRHRLGFASGLMPYSANRPRQGPSLETSPSGFSPKARYGIPISITEFMNVTIRTYAESACSRHHSVPSRMGGKWRVAAVLSLKGPRKAKYLTPINLTAFQAGHSERKIAQLLWCQKRMASVRCFDKIAYQQVAAGLACLEMRGGAVVPTTDDNRDRKDWQLQPAGHRTSRKWRCGSLGQTGTQPKCNRQSRAHQSQASSAQGGDLHGNLNTIGFKFFTCRLPIHKNILSTIHGWCWTNSPLSRLCLMKPTNPSQQALVMHLLRLI